MKKDIFKKIIIVVCKYLVPAFLGWLEGSSQIISGSASDLISLF